MTQEERNELVQIIRELSYEQREVTLASGRKSNFYFDGKQTTLHARGGLLVGKAFWQEVKQFEGPIHGVGGLTLGADPIATAVAVLSYVQGRSIAAFIVRKEPKKHGRGRWIEGPPLAEGANVVIVDDVATTGASLLKAAEAVEEAGGKVVRIITLVDRQEGAREALEAKGYQFTSLFTPADLGVQPED